MRKLFSYNSRTCDDMQADINGHNRSHDHLLVHAQCRVKFSTLQQHNNILLMVCLLPVVYCVFVISSTIITMLLLFHYIHMWQSQVENEG